MDIPIALYRKYRPQDFANLVGQEHIQTTLLNALKLGQASHAYLFCGPRGTGKTTTARLVAKGLNCLRLHETGEPCNTCEMCHAIQEGRLMDVIEIDAASNRGIDEMRDLREKIKFTPTQGKKKIFIIDEVHMLTKEAFNALLKTLEEPPSHAHLILATTESHKVPPTIVSRCQHFDFHRLELGTIRDRLKYIANAEGIAYEDEALDLIADACDGSMRDAIGLLEQLTTNLTLSTHHVQTNLGLVDRQVIDQFIDLLIHRKTQEAIAFINELYTQGIDLNQLMKETKSALRNKLLVMVTEEKRKETSQLLTLIERLEEAEFALKTATIPQLPLELMIIEWGLMEPPEDLATPLPSSSSTQEEENVTGSTNIESPVPAFLTLDRIREHWGEILGKLKSPTVRLVCRKARLLKLEDNTLTLAVESEFELEKVASTKAREEIADVITEIIKESLRVICILHKPEQGKDKVTIDYVEKVASLFEGEVVHQKP